MSLRLNTACTGNEAGAIGEGGGDFFAYSVNGNSTLAEYARPGGLRSVNGKGYGEWSCLLGFFCEVHDNGEIWANVLWDVRERFRADNVRGSSAAAINETHQLYIDALTLVATGADDAGHARCDAPRRQRPESRDADEPELLPPVGVVRLAGDGAERARHCRQRLESGQRRPMTCPRAASRPRSARRQHRRNHRDGHRISECRRLR